MVDIQKTTRQTLQNILRSFNMILVAEYVSPGHPDRLCDAIVNNIVNYVVSKDKDALCGLECAVHTNKVFIDGRIAAGKNRRVINQDKIKEIVRQVYRDAHYGDRYTANGTSHDRCWHPYPEELEIFLDVCIERLSDDEREFFHAPSLPEPETVHGSNARARRNSNSKRKRYCCRNGADVYRQRRAFGVDCHDDGYRGIDYPKQHRRYLRRRPDRPVKQRNSQHLGRNGRSFVIYPDKEIVVRPRRHDDKMQYCP